MGGVDHQIKKLRVEEVFVSVEFAKFDVVGLVAPPNVFGCFPMGVYSIDGSPDASLAICSQ